MADKSLMLGPSLGVLHDRSPPKATLPYAPAQSGWLTRTGGALFFLIAVMTITYGANKSNPTVAAETAARPTKCAA